MIIAAIESGFGFLLIGTMLYLVLSRRRKAYHSRLPIGEDGTGREWIVFYWLFCSFLFYLARRDEKFFIRLNAPYRSPGSTRVPLN
jgi:hypothetical protein